MKKLKQIFLDWSILKRVLITLLLILLFRLGTLVTLPGATVDESTFSEQASFLSLLNLLGGGGLITFSIFALGITPYITASIIIQLLSTDVIPPLSRLQKQGEKGRIKIEKITRITAIFIGIMQAIAISLALLSSQYVTINNQAYEDWVYILGYTLILIGGSMVSIWIADQITMHGVGNGTSMLILVGILGALPARMNRAWTGIIGTSADISSIMFFIFYILLFLAVIAFIGWFDRSERRIPIQQTGRGLNLMRTKQTNLPVKVNPAGVVPVIFATALMTLPPTIAQFFPDTSPGRYWIEVHFSLSNIFGLTLYGSLVFLFTIFYSHININSEQTAENFQKQSTFIIGVQPGIDTEVYLSRTITALSLIGATFLTFIAILPYLLGFIGIPNYIGIGGTSTIIMVSVAIDTWQQLNARIIASETKTVQKKRVIKSNKKMNKDMKNKNTDKSVIKESEKKQKDKSKDNNSSSDTILFE